MTAPPDLGPPETDAPAAEATAPLGAWDRVKDHKLIQWAAAYLGAALAIGQAQDLVANAFAWPSLVGRVVVITLIVGFPIALTVAWYHGHRALRRISVGELSILSALVLIGALFFTVALRRDEGAPAPAAQALNATAAPSAAPSANGTSAGGEELPNKVAVLPCENQSPDPDDAYFASGLHQDIIWQLDKLRNLTPIPRLTVLRYAGTALSTSEIAAELSVRALLGCTIRYADNRVRITAELIDSTGLQTFWQDDYEPSLTDIADVFAVQADIAMNIANALSVVFTPAEREVLEKPPTVSTEAYLLFLRAYVEPDYDKTIELFEQALAADAEFAAPRAALAFLWASELINTNFSAAVASDARAERQAKVREYAERALALDPTIPFARSALTLTDMLNWRWTEAYERLVRRARLGRRTTSRSTTSFCCPISAGTKRLWTSCNAARSSIRTNPITSGGRAGHTDSPAATTRRPPRSPPSSRKDPAMKDCWLATGSPEWKSRAAMKRAALEQLRLSEEISTAEPQPLFLPMWAYCYGRLGRSADAERLFTEMERREAAGTRFWLRRLGHGVPRARRSASCARTPGDRRRRCRPSRARRRLFQSDGVASQRHERRRPAATRFADVLGRIKGE